MKNINAIIFDLGGVIYNIKYENTISAFKKLGISNASRLYSKQQQTYLFNEFETGKISNSEFLKRIQAKTNNASIDQVEKAWNAMLINLPKERITLLNKLKAKYKIFLLSNTNAIHIKEIKNKLGIQAYNEFYSLFDKVYYSHKIKIRKPNSQTFQLILKENNLIENEVLFVDDSAQHIKSAEKIGVNTVHLKGSQDIVTLFSEIIL